MTASLLAQAPEMSIQSIPFLREAACAVVVLVAMCGAAALLLWIKGPRGSHGRADASATPDDDASEMTTVFPFRARPSVMTEPERVFFHVLVDVLRHPTDVAAPPQLRVLAQVPLCMLVEVDVAGKGRQAWQNRIDRKRVDFVLVAPDTMSTRLVIELDDASHERSDRKDRDEFLERALKAAGVPLLRVPRGTRNVYQREVVAARIRQAIS